MRIWTTVVSCVVAIIGGVCRANAQAAPASSQEERVTAAAFLITYGTTVLVQVYEARTTTNAIQLGARETNPLLARFGSGPGMVVVGLARATAINFGVRSMARRHKVAAIVVGAAMNYSYLFIAAHNNSVANRQRALR